MIKNSGEFLNENFITVKDIATNPLRIPTSLQTHVSPRSRRFLRQFWESSFQGRLWLRGHGCLYNPPKPERPGKANVLNRQFPTSASAHPSHRLTLQFPCHEVFFLIVLI